MPTWFQDVSVQHGRGSEPCCHMRDAKLIEVLRQEAWRACRGRRSRGEQRRWQLPCHLCPASRGDMSPPSTTLQESIGPAICQLFHNPRDSDVRHPCSPSAWDPEILEWFLRNKTSEYAGLLPETAARSFRARGKWKAFQGFAQDLRGQNRCCL